jgi:hypothetical protein
MSSKVGTEGQVVIEKRIRDGLGVKPGWQASFGRLVGRSPTASSTSFARRMFGYATWTRRS